MNILHAIILGIIEGVTEFLPISSTGHLILASRLLGLTQTEFLKSFEISIQAGAIAAVFLLSFRRLTQHRTLWPRIIAAFIPTAITGFFLYRIIRSVFFSTTWITLAALAAGGIIILIVEHRRRPGAQTKIEDLPLSRFVVIGLLQSLSVIPGVSRAAASIIGGELMGLSGPASVEFSFLLAIPTILAATVLDVARMSFHFSAGERIMLGTGLITAFIAAHLTVRFFLRYVATRSLSLFGVYRIVLAAVFFLLIP